MKALKLNSTVLLAIIIACLCFVTYAVSETPAIRSYAVFILFTLFCCYLFSIVILPHLASNKNQNSNNSNKSVSDTEIQQLYEILESSVKDELVVIEQELKQIKEIVRDAVKELTSGFYGLSTNIDEQQHLVNSIIDAITITEKEKLLSDLDNSTQAINKNVATTVRALQFEDIVTQLSDNSLLSANNIDEFLNELKTNLQNQLADTPLQTLAIDQLKALLYEAKAVRKEQKLQHEKVISQTNLSEGNVELF